MVPKGVASCLEADQDRKPERLACLIASRNLGDIVIWSGILKALVAAGYAEHYVVWVRPQAAGMFEGFANCEVICSPFPVGTMERFRGHETMSLLRAAARIRALRPSVSIDLVGDLRERMFARLIGSSRHLHIGWERSHPYRRLIRNPFGSGKPLVMVPASVPNVYAGYQLMLRALVKQCGAQQSPTVHSNKSTTPTYRVGLHPFASQDCKMWPAENWVRLAEDLLSRDIEVFAFAATQERAALERMFGGLDNRVSLVIGGLGQFAAAVSNLDVMVGLDSFAVHMAHRQNVASVMINAGAPADLWVPPDGRILAASGGCTHYPCYNVAPCRGRDYENACVKAISPGEVLAMVESMRLKARDIGSFPRPENCEPQAHG
jgi:heptosyltransferase III